MVTFTHATQPLLSSDPGSTWLFSGVMGHTGARHVDGGAEQRRCHQRRGRRTLRLPVPQLARPARLKSLPAIELHSQSTSSCCACGGAAP